MERKDKAIESTEEVDFEVAEEAWDVDSARCPDCEGEMERLVDHKNLFDGVLTFHLIQFRCESCEKVYVDLEQAEKYDMYLILEEFASDKSLSDLGEYVRTASEMKA